MPGSWAFDSEGQPVTFVLVLMFWVFSVCLHEFGHAVVAYFGGDTSVKDKGYLSLNPLRYMDPIYSVLMPLLFLALGGIGLPGGAVYINEGRLRSRYWSVAVSLAGPAANLIFAIALALVLNSGALDDTPAKSLLAFLTWLQISAVVLNLLPIPPLDGYGAIAPLLSYQTRQQLDGIAQYGVWILFGLLWFVPGFSMFFFGMVTQITYQIGVSPLDVEQGIRDFFFWKH